MFYINAMGGGMLWSTVSLRRPENCATQKSSIIIIRIITFLLPGCHDINEHPIPFYWSSVEEAT